MRTIELEVFKFDELSDKAKEKARDWYRQGDCAGLEYVVDDFLGVAKILGLEVRTRPTSLMSGKIVLSPEVSYSVGFCQSDFAGFDGTWGYEKGCVKAIKAYAPQDTGLHALAEQWQELQKANFYQLKVAASYHHYYGQRVTDVYRRDDKALSEGTFEGAEEAVRDLAHWLYTQLRDEAVYQTSDDTVDENMVCNSYEFYADGGIA